MGRSKGFVLFLLLVVLCAGAGGYADEIVISTPLGGFRNSSKEKVLFTQKVNYPAASVSLQEKQSTAAMIRGRIKGLLKKKERPYTLVVNGIPMPMRVNADGSFGRPYSFGSGSNSVEVVSPNGGSRARVQFYEAYAGRSEARLRVVLSWDRDGTDLDLHVVTPDGGHAYYGKRVLKNGGALDLDVTTGYGPEIFATPTPLNGVYLVYVNYYGGGEMDDPIWAQITTILHENTPDEKSNTQLVPMRKAGEVTLVHAFVYP